MLERFREFITEKQLLQPGHRTLLGVSGGMDSVVMAELFHRADHPFAIAHCNFGLRGAESDEDVAFVKELARRYVVPFFSQRFDTKAQANEQGVSLQMIARQLRYDWFEDVLKEKNYDQIAVATHRNDEIETVLINLVRGTGIGGLHGIAPKRGNVIRPLMFATRQEIEEFAENEDIEYRHDSSNESMDYIRNRIRHEVIPVLKKINPALERTFRENVAGIRETESIYRQAVEAIRTQLVREEKTGFSITIDEAKKLQPLRTWWFELLKPFGFNAAVVDDIISSLEGESGKYFYSSSHQLLKDRDELLICELSAQQQEEAQVSPGNETLQSPLPMRFKAIEGTGVEIIDDPKVALLDFEKLKFPLKLRRWKNGDAFYPLGMQSRKKLSDFFIDNKVPRTKKENTFVLTSNGDIVWVVGHRIDHRYRVSKSTNKIFKAQLEEA